MIEYDAGSREARHKSRPRNRYAWWTQGCSGSMDRVGSYDELMMWMGCGGVGEPMESEDSVDRVDRGDGGGDGGPSGVWSRDLWTMVRVNLSSTSRVSLAELRRIEDSAKAMCSDM